jgi:hypothetical protein
MARPSPIIETTGETKEFTSVTVVRARMIPHAPSTVSPPTTSGSDAAEQEEQQHRHGGNGEQLHPPLIVGHGVVEGGSDRLPAGDLHVDARYRELVGDRSIVAHHHRVVAAANGDGGEGVVAVGGAEDIR